MKRGFVYIMANARNGTVYIGSTSDLVQRVWQHCNRQIDGFTKDNDCTLLVWYEVHEDLKEARQRELQMKKWKRQWKLSTIEKDNPQWTDLYPSLL